MIIEKNTRDTLLAVEMDIGDQLRLRLADGTTRTITLEGTWAAVYETTLAEIKKPQPKARTVLNMRCRIRVDNTVVDLVRWVGTQESFYEPLRILGLTIWYDACSMLFDFLNETHGPCKPRKAARFAVQETARRICPVLLHPWCPLPPDGLRIEDCYDGSDCWMGAYFGADAHGGLDINHPAGTPIWTPIPLTQQGFFNSLAAGDNNNRWRGVCQWPDGSAWILQVHHIIRLCVPENTALPAGIHLAESAGVYVGSFEHSHFVFKIREPGASEADEILLDPWILFRQMYLDRAVTLAR